MGRQLRRFIDLVHNHYRDIKSRHVKWQPHFFPVDASVAAVGLKIFAAAKDMAKSDRVEDRVGKASILAYRAVLDSIFKLDKDADLDPAVAKQSRPTVEEFFRPRDK